jgi:hypothetical protein
VLGCRNCSRRKEKGRARKVPCAENWRTRFEEYLRRRGPKIALEPGQLSVEAVVLEFVEQAVYI